MDMGLDDWPEVVVLEKDALWRHSHQGCHSRRHTPEGRTLTGEQSRQKASLRSMRGRILYNRAVSTDVMGPPGKELSLSQEVGSIHDLSFLSPC